MPERTARQRAVGAAFRPSAPGHECDRSRSADRRYVPSHGWPTGSSFPFQLFDPIDWSLFLISIFVARMMWQAFRDGQAASLDQNNLPATRRPIIRFSQTGVSMHWLAGTSLSVPYILLPYAVLYPMNLTLLSWEYCLQHSPIICFIVIGLVFIPSTVPTTPL